jgi:hypothetical protein
MNFMKNLPSSIFNSVVAKSGRCEGFYVSDNQNKTNKVWRLELVREHSGVVV